MTTAGLEDSPIARLILSQERSHPLPPATKDAAQNTKDIASTLPIVILTEDAVFAKQVRSALDSNGDIATAVSLDEATALAASGHCSILITDTIITRGAIESATRELRTHDPALAFIVAGPRDHGGMFIGLQSSGAIDGFLLKPVTAGSAQVLIESAMKRHRAFLVEQPVSEPTRVRRPNRHTRPAAEADVAVAQTIEAQIAVKPVSGERMVPTRPTSDSRLPRPTWSLVLLALLLVGGGAWWLSSQQATERDSQQVITDYLQRAEYAAQQGRWLGARDSATAYFQSVLALDPTNLVAQRGLDQVAVQLSKQVQGHIAEKRLGPAASAIERLRDFQPDYAELPLLEMQLAVLRDQVIASAAAPAPLPELKTQEVSKPEPTTRARERVAKTEPTRAPSDTPKIAPASTESASRVASKTEAVIERPVAAPPTEAASEPLAAAIAPATNSSEPTPVSIDPPATTLASLARPTIAAPTIAPEPVTNEPKLAKYVAPTYPAEARARGIGGWIQVQMEVTPAGNVVSAHVQDGEKRQLFARAALAAVKQWKYEPRPEASGSVPVSVRLEFQLKE